MVRGVSNRSPAMKYCQKVPDAPLKFFPPSYYAKAGGFQIPVKGSVNKTLDQESEIEGFLGSGIFPISYPSELNSSDSSSEAKTSRDAKFSMLMRKRSGSSMHSNLSSHRQGRMAGLPELEAHLLPSLRDTVDKMTKPSQINATTTVPYEPDSTVPGIRSPHRSSTAFNIAGGISPAISRSTKSAMHSTMSRLTPKPEPPVTSVASSLRTVKSMLTRKLSVPPRANVGRDQIKQGVPVQGRARSTTDPGATPVSRAKAVATSYTQRLPHRQHFGSPSIAPRDEASSVIATQYTDESEVERDYEFASPNLRQLVVTNADIVASSSSSGAETSHLYYAPLQSHHQSHLPKYSVYGRAGLGLHFPQPSERSDELSTTNSSASTVELQPEVQDFQQYHGTNHEVSRRAPIASEKNNAFCFYDINNRTHTSLAGLVEGFTAPPAYASDYHSSDSDYYVQQGLAIGESADLSVPVGQGLEHPTNYIQLVGLQSRTAQDTASRSYTPAPVNFSHKAKKVTYEPEGANSGHTQCDRYGSIPNPIQYSASPLSSTHGILRAGVDHNGIRCTSRSPIIHQIQDTRIPLAVRRYSVYRNMPQTTNSLSGGSSLPLNVQQHPNLVSPYTSQGVGVLQGPSVPISHADSGLSSLGRAGWRESFDELSSGAEQLFRSIADPTNANQSETGKRGTSGAKRSLAPVYTNGYPQESTFDDSIARVREIEAPFSPSRRLASRVFVIEEIVGTEASFADRLQLFVKIFIRPLRVRGTRSWIQGIPTETSRLLDWFEDIANLHSEMSSRLQDQWRFDSGKIAESLRPYIFKFEIYQPYLVHLANVSAAIDRMVQDPSNDFGTFVKLQQRNNELDGYSIASLLLEPIARLSKYPKLFSRLLDATAKSHPDYLSSFSLFHSTNLIIKVLTEVKVREDEYELIKRLSRRIKGLPISAQLAQRERRLLLQGVLQIMPLDGTNNSSDGRLMNWTAAPLNDLLSPRAPDRTSRLVDAVHQWSLHRQRSESLASTNTDTSASCYSTTSSSGTVFNSTRPSQIPVLSSRSNPRLQRSAQATTTEIPSSKHPNPSLGSAQIFVFTDLLVVTTPDAGDDSSRLDEWTLNDKFGVCRVFNIAQIQNDPNTFLVDILPLDLNNINDVIQHDSTSMRTLRLTLPPSPATPTSNQAQTQMQMDDTMRRSWLSAFQSCLHSTLRLVSVGRSEITQLPSSARETVLSILSSGLPLPKSPSMQQQQGSRDRDAGPSHEDVQRLEREQRGWWSLRFHRVLQELSRQDSSYIV